MLYRIEYTAACHRGRLRRTNQDNYFCNGRYLPADHEGLPSLLKGTELPDPPALFAVFDGMGGEDRGEMASFLAARAMESRTWDRRASSLAEACHDANRCIVRFTEEQRLNTCGTTAAMLLFDAGGVVRCHIGDSRIYRFRNSRIDQLSEDDVFPAPGMRKPPLLQFLGVPEEEMRIEPHTGLEDAVAGDIYLICSDGLSDMVPKHVMADIIRGTPFAEAGKSLLQAALDAGGRDNITFFLIGIRQA